MEKSRNGSGLQNFHIRTPLISCRAEVGPDPELLELTPAGFCIFLSEPDPESKICEKPDPDP